MVAFRRIVFALALVMLLSGLASAQTQGSPLTCTANVAVPPLLRSEGVTDLIGDIVLTCTGGFTTQYVLNPANCTSTATSTTPGCVPLPTANITVSLATNVTSRLLNTNVSPNWSEALLLIDEPGSGLTQIVPGYGPGSPQTLCPTPAQGAGVGGCPQYAIPAPNGAVQAVMSGLTFSAGGVSSLANPANEYLGLWNSAVPNQITFNGIPVLPPVSGGVSRIYRITNIRANTSGYPGAGFAGTQQLNASVSISSSTSLTLSQAVLIAGFIEASLSVGVRNLQNTGAQSSTSNGTSFSQCGSATLAPATVMQYTEIFASAFKVRNSPLGAASGQNGNLIQNIPGTIYNSESGFEIPTGAAGLSTPTGLADYGTRFQATFHNVPSGVRLFVTVNNVTNVGTAYTGSYTAGLVTAVGSQGVGTAPDFATFSGTTTSGAPLVASTTSAAGLPLAEIIPDSTGTAVAVWESLTNNPAAIDQYNFALFITYSASSGINSPPIPAGSSAVITTVNMSYAPIPSGGAVAAVSSSALQAWQTASGSLTIPRFVDTSVAINAFNIAICQTVLLFPFVTNQSGFDTGLAISNTTTDPFGTKNQAGVCQLYAYGNAAPTSQPACTSSTTTTGAFCMPGTTSTGAVAATGYVVSTGTTTATLASALAPGFQGYMFAVCNFQLAHGFAFISDIGARNLAMGYLALIVPTGTGNRNNIIESLTH